MMEDDLTTVPSQILCTRAPGLELATSPTPPTVTTPLHTTLTDHTGEITLQAQVKAKLCICAFACAAFAKDNAYFDLVLFLGTMFHLSLTIFNQVNKNMKQGDII